MGEPRTDLPLPCPGLRRLIFKRPEGKLLQVLRVTAVAVGPWMLATL